MNPNHEQADPNATYAKPVPAQPKAVTNNTDALRLMAVNGDAIDELALATFALCKNVCSKNFGKHTEDCRRRNQKVQAGLNARR